MVVQRVKFLKVPGLWHLCFQAPTEFNAEKGRLFFNFVAETLLPANSTVSLLLMFGMFTAALNTGIITMFMSQYKTDFK